MNWIPVRKKNMRNNTYKLIITVRTGMTLLWYTSPGCRWENNQRTTVMIQLSFKIPGLPFQ